MNLFLSYLLIAVLELTVLPTGQMIQKIDRELSRKWGHVLAGTILWFGSLLFDNMIHHVIAVTIYTISVTIIRKMGLIAEQREDPSLDNEKAALLYGSGNLIVSLLLLIDETYLLHYGLATFTLAFGDAFAALVGIRFGKYSIKLHHNKSLIGSISFIIAAVVGMLIPCTILGYGLTLLPQLIILATIGCIVELYSGNWDNLLIQIVVGLAAFIIL